MSKASLILKLKRRGGGVKGKKLVLGATELATVYFFPLAVAGNRRIETLSCLGKNLEFIYSFQVLVRGHTLQK